MESEVARSISSFNPNLKLSSASTVPADWYTDPRIAKLERDHVFKNTWQYVGRGDQLENAGDFITARVGGQPIIVARNKENVLQAFANVCRHRAARVECRASGNASRFRCRYHGWAYDLNGNLCGTPDFEGVEGFEKSECPLPQFQVGTFENFVFVHLGKPESSFQDFIAPLEKYKTQMKLNDLVFYERREWILNCNWKIFVDNYQDGGYHINTLHPDLAKVVNMNTYDTELFPQASLQLSPLKPAKTGDSAATLNEVRGGDAAFYWWLDPNLMINAYDQVMDINIVEPMGEAKCRVIFDFYFSQSLIDGDQRFIEDSMKVSSQVQDEDIEICEEIQNNLGTGVFDTGRFSVRREAGGHLFHNLLAKKLQKAL